jgi:DNA-binding LytR/AlgR family response regulator
MKTLRKIGVLDDEKLAMDGLVAQLKKLLPSAEVVGFQMYESFEQWCSTEAPDLVFLDMEMPQTMGLEVAKRVQKKVGNIVFVTAHTEYSLAAFETAVDYILKPVSTTRLLQALNKLGELKPFSAFEERVIKIPIKGTFQPIAERKILYLKGQRNYTEVVLSSEESHLVAKTLKSFEESLSDRFVRVHKSLLVRKDAVTHIHWGSKVELVLEGGALLEASKSRMEEYDWSDV